MQVSCSSNTAYLHSGGTCFRPFAWVTTILLEGFELFLWLRNSKCWLEQEYVH